jgi:hypothetical protein
VWILSSILGKEKKGGSSELFWQGGANSFSCVIAAFVDPTGLGD